MSFDKQIPAEVPVHADSHPISGQNSDSNTDVSLPFDQYYENDYGSYGRHVLLLWKGLCSACLFGKCMW